MIQLPKTMQQEAILCLLVFSFYFVIDMLKAHRESAGNRAASLAGCKL